MPIELDRNKSALTHRMTATAAAYLDGLGCKPVETEVQIRRSWIADLASYWYPTQTEARRLGLLRKAREMFGIEDGRLSELIPRTFGYGPFTVIIEVKATKPDFHKDHRKWTGDFPAHICFVAFPIGMLGKEEIPTGWYGLEMSQNGQQLHKVHRHFGMPHAQHPGLALDFVAAVGIRRDHRTRYTASRAWLKAYRAQDSERERQYSASRLLCGLADWIQGIGCNRERPLLEVLPELGIKKTPDYAEKAIGFFESVKRGEWPKTE